MSRTVKALLSAALAALFVVNSWAQQTAPQKQTSKPGATAQKAGNKKPVKDPSEQLDALQGKLEQAQAQIQQQQTQIEQLQKSLQDSVSI